MAELYICTNDFNYCCGALEIGNFGGGEQWETEEDEFSVKDLKDSIRTVLSSAKKRAYSVVFATTMSNQPNAAEALSQLGFYTTKPFKKTYADKRKMQAWFLPLVEFKG